jgi:FixJ family two-component response regulator
MLAPKARGSDLTRICGRVLVIDADAGVRSAIADLLAGAGYAVEQTCEAATGLQMAAVLEPGVILVNLALPMRSGLDVLNRLKEQQPTCEIPVTVVGAYAIVLMRSNAGHVDWSPRDPLNPEQLLQHVRHVTTLKHPNDALPHATA